MCPIGLKSLSEWRTTFPCQANKINSALSEVSYEQLGAKKQWQIRITCHILIFLFTICREGVGMEGGAGHGYNFAFVESALEAAIFMPLGEVEWIKKICFIKETFEKS